MPGLYWDFIMGGENWREIVQKSEWSGHRGYGDKVWQKLRQVSMGVVERNFQEAHNLWQLHPIRFEIRKEIFVFSDNYNRRVKTFNFLLKLISDLGNMYKKLYIFP